VIKKKHYCVFSIVLIFSVSYPCVAQQEDVPEPVFLNFSIQPPYIPTYHGRDPFKPLDNIVRSVQLSIAELDYHGVIQIGGSPLALFTWRGNPSVRYVLKLTKLFGANEQVVDGVVGEINDDAVILVQGDQKIAFPRK
jgi:hypothetical protein